MYGHRYRKNQEQNNIVYSGSGIPTIYKYIRSLYYTVLAICMMQCMFFYQDFQHKNKDKTTTTTPTAQENVNTMQQDKKQIPLIHTYI